MAQIVCEICGSSEMIKKDGVFQCECCGMKYSLEEIRSMLGAAPSAQPAPAVFQTVPERHDDKSDTVAKYLQFARLAKSKEDWAESEKYYKLVEMEDPTNIEAAFYGSYGKAKASLMDSNLYQRQAVFKILHNVISMLPQNYNPARSEEQDPIILQISNDIIAMAGSEYVYNYTKNGYGQIIKLTKPIAA